MFWNICKNNFLILSNFSVYKVSFKFLGLFNNKSNKKLVLLRMWWIFFGDVSEESKKKNGIFPNKGYTQTYPPLPLRIAPIFMKDAHSAETNEKTIFRFLFFQVMANCIHNLQCDDWIFKCVTNQKKSRLKVVKFTENMRNELKRMKNSKYLVFAFCWFLYS